MRISDWSSDVCSSDLSPAAWPAAFSGFLGIRLAIARSGPGRFPTNTPTATPPSRQPRHAAAPLLHAPVLCEAPPSRDTSRRSRHRSEEHTSELQSLMLI